MNSNQLERLEKQLRSGFRHFTLTEAATRTGLSIDETNDALDVLMGRYLCRLQVTDQGDLIFDFGERLRRRDAKTLRERWQDFLKVSWKVFAFLFRIWLTVTLVVYFVVFLLVLLALILASRSQQGESRGQRSGGPNIDLSALPYLFYSIFRWRTTAGGMIQRRDRRGYSYRQFEPLKAALKPGKKNFIASVYDFVLGPPRVEPDPLHNQRELAAFAREQKGIFVTADLEALAGFDAPQADIFFTDCLSRFHGKVDVSGKGVVYGEISSALRNIGQEAEAKVIYYWDEYEPEYELTGNSSGRNLVIMLLNGFNWFMSFLIAGGAFAGIQAQEGTLPGMIFSLLADFPLLFGWIPLIFSTLFFLIPLFRWIQVRRLRKKRHLNNQRKRYYRVIFQNRGRAMTAEEVHQQINRGGSEETLSLEAVEKMMDTLVLDLSGETRVSDAGQVLYAFPRIELELQEAPRIRAERGGDGSLGKVVMDSD